MAAGRPAPIVVGRSVASQLAEAEREYDALLEEKAALDLEIADIRMQLEAARAKVRAEGVQREQEWYERASYALRVRGRKSQALQRKIGEAGRKVRRVRHGQIERCFVDAARTVLDYDTFNRVWHEAQRLSLERISGGSPANDVSP